MSNRRTRVIGAALLIIVAGFALNVFAPAAAATYVPGVKAGDYLKYDITATGTSVEFKIEITSVSGTLVYFTVTILGTSGSGSIDVGDPSLPLGRFVLAKALNPGDQISPGNPVTFSSSSSRTYAGGSRTVNHASFANSTHIIQCYYDKETGVLCEMGMRGPPGSVTMVLKETNLWLNVVLVILVVTVVSVIAIIVVAVVIVIRKRRRKTADTGPVAKEAQTRDQTSA